MFSISLILFLLNIHGINAVFDEHRVFKPGDVTLGGLFDVHFNGPEDNCGELFTMGLGHVEAMLFAIERINNDSRLLPNVTIGYDIRDYCENAARAMTMAYDLVKNTDPFCRSVKSHCAADNSSSDPVVALIGPYDSASSVLVGSLLQVQDIAAISPTATSNELSSRMYRHFFRTVPCDTWQAKAMADIIEHFNWTYIAAIALDDSYGRQGVWAVEKEVYKRRTFCIAFSEFIPRLGYAEKLSKIVSKLKQQRNIGVVIVWLSGGHGRAFLQETSKQGVNDRTWIFSESITAEEAVHLDPRFTGLDGSLGIQLRDYRDQPFDEHLRQMTRTKTLKSHLSWWDEFWGQQCKGSYSECKENVKSYQSIKKVRSSFVPYVLDAVYAVAHAIDKIYKCVEPYGLLPGGKCPDFLPSIAARHLRLYLQNVSFEGVTGKVKFDQFGDPEMVSYDIVNFQREQPPGKRYKKVLVGSWTRDAKPQLALTSAVIWNANIQQLVMPRSVCAEACPPGTRQSPTTPCCWECIKCPQGTISTRPGSNNCSECTRQQRSNMERTKCTELPIVRFQVSSVSGVIITVLASFGLFMSIFTWVIFVMYFNTPVAKASNREMSLILLAGVTSLFIMPLVNLLEPTDFICRFSHCGRLTVWVLCVSILLVKTMLIVSAFRNDLILPNVKPFLAKASTQRAILTSLAAFQISMTIAWLTLGPPYKETTIAHLQHISVICKAHSSNTGKNILLANITYGLFLSTLCTYFAFRVRNVPENFNEAKRIGFSMYILLLSVLAYYPVAFATGGWHVTVLECASTITSGLGFLLCMFAPRVYIILFKPGQNTLLASRVQVSNYSFATTTRSHNDVKK